MEPRREDFPEQHVCENEFSPDQQLWIQEENSGLEQEEPELPQVKEEQDELEPPLIKEEQNEPEPPLIKLEQEELCISQEGEQLVVKLEVDTFMVPLFSEENQQSEAEPNSEQLLSHSSAGTEIQDEKGSRHVDFVSTKEEEEEPKPKKRRLRTGSHHEEVQVTEAAVQAEKPRLPSPQPPAPDLQRGYQGVPRPNGRSCLSSEFWVCPGV
ncbi:uncharacterized protein KZ484_011945 [Pholidichthys leucotaenia]